MSRSRCRGGVFVGWAPLLVSAGIVAAAPANPAWAFLESLNPFADTKDALEGRFIDTLEPGPWTPPLARLAAERAAADRESGTRDGGIGPAGRDGDFPGTFPRETSVAPSPPPDPVPDGLTLLRISEKSVANVPVWENYLNGIGTRLLAGSPVTGVPVRFYVTASENYGSVHAFPDGAVGVPLGLLRNVHSEDELAFILGHEAAHIVLGHHDNDWFQSMNQNMVSAAELALGLGVALSQKLGKGGLSEEAAKAALIAGATLFVADKGLFPSFTREQEDEADLLSLDLEIRAGYNAQGAFDAFDRLRAEDAARAERDSPYDEERAAIEQETAESARAGAVGQLVKSVSELFLLAVREAADELAVTHRSAAAREESLLDYFLTEYADVVPPDSAALELEAVRQSPEGQELFDRYESARGAMDSIKHGRLDEAESLAREAVGGNFKNDSLTRWAFFQTRLQQGKLDRARRNLELALEAPRATLAVYRDLVDIHWAQGRRKEAMELLKTAFEVFQKPPELYADLIYRHYLLGDRTTANAMAIKCKFRNRGAGALCSKAAKGESPRLQDKAHAQTSGSGAYGPRDKGRKTAPKRGEP